MNKRMLKKFVDRNLKLEKKRTKINEEPKMEDLIKTIDFLKLPYADEITHLGCPTDDVLSSSDRSNIPAHGFLLSLKSPVFKAMLYNDMLEKRMGVIKIGGVSKQVLQAFVNYMYTVDVPVDLEINPVCELLELADRYQVDHLKTYCENFLVNMVCKENAFSFFKFAHNHRFESLRLTSLSWIARDVDTLSQQEAYKKLVQTDPQIALAMYESLFE